MKQLQFIVLLISISTGSLFAQGSNKLKNVMNLSVKPGKGSNGAGVTWHPVQQNFYAGMAGNETYPLTVYNAKGVQVSADDLETMTDLRGLWYYSQHKSIQSNGYNDYGIREYQLNKQGIPFGTEIIREGMYQPSANSVGSYDPVKKRIYFLTNNEHLAVAVYNTTAYEQEYMIQLHLQNTTKNPDKDVAELEEHYNTSTVIFTAIKNQELMLLNIEKHHLEFYNLEGYMTATKLLPEEAPMPSLFNFAYAKGIVWLFDKESRIWRGYK